MKRSRRIRVTILAAMLAVPAVAQEHPDRIGRWGEDRYAWIAASQIGAVATAGDLATLAETSSDVDFWTVERIGEQIADFTGRFGSAEEQGLAEGSYPSTDFCYEPEIVVLGQGPFPETKSLDGTLLLAEVAVTATVSGIVPGFSIMGGPTVLLNLSDVTLLTDRSPIPQYALLPLRSMVINGSVFCDAIVGFAYQPQVGDRIALFGSWDRGVVPLGPVTTSMIGKVGDSGTAWNSWSVSVDRVGDVDSVIARISEMESEGLLATTLHLSRQAYMAEDRHDFADALGYGDCSVSGIDTGGDGRLNLDLSCRETER